MRESELESESDMEMVSSAISARMFCVDAPGTMAMAMASVGSGSGSGSSLVVSGFGFGSGSGSGSLLTRISRVELPISEVSDWLSLTG